MFNKSFLGGAGAGGAKSGPSPEEGCSVLDEETSPIMNALFSGDHRGRFMLRLFEGFDMDAVMLLDLLRIHCTRERLVGTSQSCCLSGQDRSIVSTVSRTD